jgi:hypothetical protein
VKRTCTWLATALVFAVFGTATALAQPAPPAVKVETDSSDAKYVTPVLTGDMQEEVEILRRLLDNSFAEVYGRSPPLSSGEYLIQFGTSGGPQPMGSMTPGGMPPARYLGSMRDVWDGAGSMTPGGMPPARYSRAERPAPDLEGVYLKDYGVVYTVTLPPPPGNPLPGPTVGVVNRTPLSPWERTRKELRGEKIEDEGKPVNGSPSLSEVILKVLAENGKHFTRLAEGERITVAVTFRDAVGEYHVPIQSSVREHLVPIIDAENSSGESQPGSSTNRNPMPPGGGGRVASEEGAAWLTDVRNAIQLGDLHLKQGKGQDAIAAYKEAADKLSKEVLSRRIAQARDIRQFTPDKVLFLLMGVDLYNKLAEAYVKMGRSEDAHEALQKASELAKQAETLTGGAATANPRPSTPALPSKLVVTASKKLLDEVGSGKMTFEAFRKAATVEYVRPSADKK